MTAATATPIDLARLDLGSFAGQPVAVLGLARSGVAAARFLSDRGARVTVYDARPASELADQVARLEGRAVELRLGPGVDPVEVLDGQALVCTSPSISSRFPTTEPRLRAALGAVEQAGHVPVVSEVDLFLRLCPARTVGVTGTKGKTTTSSMIAAVLARGDAPVLLGGNIGRPLIEELPGLTSHHRVVLELSELQLPTLSRGTDVAVYTHVTADHVDRHGSVEAYRRVKRILASLVSPDGALVLDDEDPVSRTFGDGSTATVVRYRRTGPTPGGVGVLDGWLVASGVPVLEEAGRSVTGRVLPLDAIPVPGWHSVSNAAAAIAAGLLLGIDAPGVRAGLEGFGGVEHRLEPVAGSDGVRFVNDSQGTQPDAVAAALRAFPAPIVLIAGGRAKGLDMSALASVVAERAAAAVLIGESGPDLAAAFTAAGLARTERAGSMAEAVTRADAIARELLAAGDPVAAGHPGPMATVLLSPAAASFDMFRDYEERGHAFKDAVRALVARRAASTGAASTGAATTGDATTAETAEEAPT